MNKIKIMLLTLLISNIVFFYLYVTSNGDGSESFGDKHEWGILQGLEFDHRQKPITNIEFSDIEGYHIICIPSESGHRTWIMLNPKHPPYYKQMPQEQYTLSSDQLDQIEKYRIPTSTVEICLLSHKKKNEE